MLTNIGNYDKTVFNSSEYSLVGFGKPKPSWFWFIECSIVAHLLLESFYNTSLDFLPNWRGSTFWSKRVSTHKNYSKSRSYPSGSIGWWIKIGWKYFWLKSAAPSKGSENQEKRYRKFLRDEGQQCCTWWTYNQNQNVLSTVRNSFVMVSFGC